MPDTRPPAPRRWATINEAMEYARCSRHTIYRRIKSGELNEYRNGRTIMIDLDEVDAMLRAPGNVQASGLTWGELRTYVRHGNHYHDDDLVHPGTITGSL